MSDTVEKKLTFKPASWHLEDTNARIERAYETANDGDPKYRYPVLAGALMGELDKACKEIAELRRKLPARPKLGELAACPFCEDEPSIEYNESEREYYAFCHCCECNGPKARNEVQARNLWNDWTKR